MARDFSQIPNELITDSNLSGMAFRIVVYLFSKPHNWNVNNKDIQNRFGIKRRETMSKYWKEIEASGWIIRTRKTDEKGKMKAGYDYQLNTKPCTNNPDTEKPDTAEGMYGKTGHGKTGLRTNRTLSNTDSLSNTDIEKQKNNKKNAPSAFDDSFLENKFNYLWGNIRLKKVGKNEAKKSFNKLCKTRWKTKEKIEEATIGIIEDIDERLNFIGDRKSPFKNKHLSTYLNNNGWEDEETEVWE